MPALAAKRGSVVALEVVAVALEVQSAKLGGRLSDHVAFADEDLVGEVRHAAPDAAIRPAHDDLATSGAGVGLFDPEDLHDRRLGHDLASLAWVAADAVVSRAAVGVLAGRTVLGGGISWPSL